METMRKEETNKAEKQTQKKPYERPELQKHGNVESLTQTPSVGGSQPIKFA